MKDKLLITMGCSMTEGHGCYDYSLLDLENNPKLSYLDISIKDHEERFHEFGWPNRVGRKLGFNKVLNIGKAGTSNPFHLILFQENILPRLRRLRFQYDIYLIWMMTESYRQSFVGDPDIVNLSPLNYQTELERNFMEFSLNRKLLLERQQAYLIQQAEIMFDRLRINYLFTSWNSSFIEVYNHLKTDRLLSPLPDYVRQSANPLLKSKICKHPNEEGYEHIANEIVKKVRKFHPEFDMGFERQSTEWEYIKYKPSLDQPFKNYKNYLEKPGQE